MFRYLLEIIVQVIAGMAVAGTASTKYSGNATFANVNAPSVIVPGGLVLEAFFVSSV